MKQIVTGIKIIIEIFFPQFIRCCCRSSISRQHFTDFGDKIFNDDFNAGR